MEDTAELVFIATPSMGHLVAQVELAKHLVAQHPQISIPILIPHLPMPDEKLNTYLQSTLLPDQISFVELPPLDELSTMAQDYTSKRHFLLLSLLARLYKPTAKRVIETRRRRNVGILTDMLITDFFDVADELGVPSYVFSPSGANLLSMMLEFEDRGVDAPSDSATVEVPGLRYPVPVEAWPGIFMDEENCGPFLLHASRYRRAKGMLVNTFAELENDVLVSLLENERCPPVYSIGPVINLDRRITRVDGGDPIIDWLDGQPTGTVVFLCFGSMGSFVKEQVEQITAGIEQSGHRFLWSLRRQPIPGNKKRLPTDYDDFREVLPTGFLERTAKLGKMIGWAPQADVLAHPAVGAFVSHCGWNSVLESLWFGVPVVAWPMYAEQQLNAFSLVRELGIAVEVRMDYRYDLVVRKGNVVVTAADVERGIRRMMEEEEGEVVRKKVKEMSELAKKAFGVGGSSNKALQCFAQDVFKNVS